MNYLKIEKFSTNNGTGVRTVLWVSGCRCHCENCHNPETWDFCAGMHFDESSMDELLAAVAPEWIDGLTLSGGHPLEPENILDVYKIATEIKKHFPTKSIWLYTGFTYESFANNEGVMRLIKMCDVVVDGAYVDELKDISLLFRGSKNQRIIDVKKTLQSKEVVLWEEK